ncbi:MAG TPA: AbrB/MazE/SpoVT family DNA-binding domain-containing protein [Nitrososphaera sp.]
MYRVRVKRKGQVTVPADIRERMNMEEGSLLEIEERPDGILLKPLSAIKIGKVAGKKEHDKIINELDRLRSEWR